jgi:hypothetical protein
MRSLISLRGENKDSEELELVLVSRSQILIEMVREALEGEGIPAMIKSVTGYHARGMLPFQQGFFDYRLYVSKEDSLMAKEIVETIIPPEDLR